METFEEARKRAEHKELLEEWDELVDALPAVSSGHYDKMVECIKKMVPFWEHVVSEEDEMQLFVQAAISEIQIPLEQAVVGLSVRLIRGIERLPSNVSAFIHLKEQAAEIELTYQKLRALQMFRGYLPGSDTKHLY